METTRHRFQRGFTLIEIVLVLVIMSILIGTMVPSFKGLAAERLAREPILELRAMAREARFLAMKEHRPYQISFDSQGFRLTRHFSPYAERADIDEFLAVSKTGTEQSDAPDTTSAEVAAIEKRELEEARAAGFIPPEEDFQWLRRAEKVREYRLPEGVRAEVRFWAEPTRTPLGGNVYRQWVFQPSGVCDPLRVTFYAGTREQMVAFSALTAEIDNEVRTDN